MGFVHVKVTLSNPRTDDPPLHATALVDIGALHLCLPESLLVRWISLLTGFAA